LLSKLADKGDNIHENVERIEVEANIGFFLSLFLEKLIQRHGFGLTFHHKLGSWALIAVKRFS